MRTSQAGHDPTAFARLLRAAGVAVPVERVIAYAAALGALAGSTSELRPAEIYWAGRCTLLGSPEDRTPYDRVFAEHFLGVPPAPTSPAGGLAVEVGYDSHGQAVDEEEPSAREPPGVPERAVRWSVTEVLRHRDFRDATQEELRELWAAIAQLRLAPPTLRARRFAPSRSGAVDLRRSARAALARDGEVIELRRRHRTTRDPGTVLILDVSGSMEPYARALLRFAHAVSHGRRSVEVFAVGTRLTRLTRTLATRDPDAAMRAAAGEVTDWSGGTRLGESIATFVQTWGQRGIARGAVVVLLSDGWDRGDPATLAEAMERLSRLARRVVWVNPLRASPGYAPLARGMAAALPYCDHFVDGHSLASLDSLAALLVTAGAGS